MKDSGVLRNSRIATPDIQRCVQKCIKGSCATKIQDDWITKYRVYSLENNAANCIDSTAVPLINPDLCLSTYQGYCSAPSGQAITNTDTEGMLITQYEDRASGHRIRDCRYLCSKEPDCATFFVSLPLPGKCHLFKSGCLVDTTKVQEWQGWDIRDCPLKRAQDVDSAVSALGGNPTWLTAQQDDTEYGKVYQSVYGGAPNYGEYCAYWENTDRNVFGGGKKGVAGANTDCANLDTRPDWCADKWCYVKTTSEENTKIVRNPLDSNAPGYPDGPNCEGLSDVTKSENQDTFLWYSYEICNSTPITCLCARREETVGGGEADGGRGSHEPA
ncbi:unnamed protein product [Amoebophrya sp. A120]|nr:unnamed protein product [Amoebophrya sp. A120]|eukprot:GSA120T00013511001.1